MCVQHFTQWSGIPCTLSRSEFLTVACIPVETEASSASLSTAVCGICATPSCAKWTLAPAGHFLGLVLEILTHKAACFFKGTMLSIWVTEEQALDNGLVVQIYFPKYGANSERTCKRLLCAFGGNSLGCTQAMFSPLGDSLAF